MKLRILVLTSWYPHPVDSSAGIFIEETITHTENDVIFKVVSPAPWFLPIRLFKKWYRYRLRPKHEFRKGIEIIRPRTLVLPRDFLSLQGWCYVLSMLNIIFPLNRRFKFNLIHAHEVYPSGFAAVLLGKMLRKKVIITVHTGDFRHKMLHPLSRRYLSLYALHNCFLCIFVSDAQRKEVVLHTGNKIKYEVIPNGVSHRFIPAHHSTSESNSHPKHKPALILFVGHLVKEKGVQYLLDALKHLVENNWNNFESIIIGDGALKKKLVNKSEELGISSKVQFLGGQTHEDVLKWINKCDLLVLPSIRESFGVVIIEAMACGKPVVATRCGGPEEIVTEETGILVPPQNHVALADGIKFTIENIEKYDPERISAIAYADYNLNQIGKQIVDVYHSIL
jgi:glycosyltransferase involved in cell wall biosynthesis